MADLSEYESLNGIEFSQKVKQLMELFAESWKECRSDECRACKYRHGKKLYQLLFCLAERYADKLISNGYAQVRHGRWKKGSGYVCGDYQFFCSFCGEEFWESSYWPKRSKYCPNCGAKMDKEVEENGKETDRAEGEEPGKTDVPVDDRA